MKQFPPILLCLTLVSLLAIDTALGDTSFGAEIELVCPCTISSASSSSVETGFGVINRLEQQTGVLTLEVYAHTAASYRDADSPHLISETLLISVLPGSSSIEHSDRQLPLSLPMAGDYYVTLVLLEDGVVKDESRSEGLITFADNLAVDNRGTGLYFVGDPSISIAGSTLSLTLPGIGNGSLDDISMQVQVIATDTPRLVSTFEVVATRPGALAIEAAQQSGAENLNLDFTDPGPALPFYHVLVFSDEVVHLVHTVQSSESFNTLAFSTSEIDYLTDTDGDGVADANERLEGTDPVSAASTPGDSMVDVLAVYNSDVAALYGGDPGPRIDAVIAASNQALNDSGVAMSLRLVESAQLAYSSATSQAALLASAEDSLGVFSGLQTLRDNAEADLVVIFLADDEAGSCGLASQGGYPTQGHLARSEHISVSVLDAADCDDLTMMHGIGHNMGLNHSFDEDASGTFVWARGHGVSRTFATIMSSPVQYDIEARLPYFSNPDILLCELEPCGIDIGENEPANAVLALNITRFQVARFSDGATSTGGGGGSGGGGGGGPPPVTDDDADDDGVPDDEDAFPSDPEEFEDTDSDGVGNNADTDDDNDGMPDEFERANLLDPLFDDASEDPDMDNFTNLQEYLRGSDPQVADPASFCDDPGVEAPLAADSNLMFERRLSMANPGSNVVRQSFIRLLNPTSTEASIEVYGIDDAGSASRNPPVTLVLPAESARQVTVGDLELGNAMKGLSGSLCDLDGKWQLIFRADQPIEIAGFIRSVDGFLTGMSALAPEANGVHQLNFSNPARNPNQQSFVRITNLSDESGVVAIRGVDDAGQATANRVTFSLAANSSLQVTAEDLETGNAAKGLSGSFGQGVGKWRLTVSAEINIAVMSLMRAPGGFLTNLSSVVPRDSNDESVVLFVSPASEEDYESFIRVSNTSLSIANVTVNGIDDSGALAPNGEVRLVLAPGASKQMTATDLESGNSAKGLLGSLGDGEGRWRLAIAADQPIEVMSLIRTPDGFVTNMSAAKATVAGNASLIIMNPGSNPNQRSSLRLVNVSSQAGGVVITAIDDAGEPAPGGEVTFNLLAGEAISLTAAELEMGRADIAGALGDGAGKWRVIVSSDVALRLQSLLESPGGYVTNLTFDTD